ncbi:hypothetical protein M422DRAFT_277362 [Sphaerobolus stellatus SS14]|uniref:F-box domain-containing protein n=1 Tax=Sphaerobolus stellatus (strain SS14) TaxID=990650 RepID=A0A0C9T0N8_SPHS4|nr:hypothetical protein M422DRAFT_277362 [Sphaerobolus stellatus SS14]
MRILIRPANTFLEQELRPSSQNVCNTTLDMLRSTLPTELNERTFSYVDHTQDLLHLALACKTWKAVIIPRHIQMRHTRCDHRRETPNLSNRPCFIGDATLDQTRENRRKSHAFLGF